jgi:tRNA1(Val) A37 N6-methylase TrmN6
MSGKGKKSTKKSPASDRPDKVKPNFTKNISSTDKYLEQWTNVFAELPKLKTVVDMTGNVGSEGIFISKFDHIKKVDIYEIDKEVYKGLEENVASLPAAQRDKITTHKGDSTVIITDKKNGPAAKGVDLVLFDPPWGGDDYK